MRRTIAPGLLLVLLMFVRCELNQTPPQPQPMSARPDQWSVVVFIDSSGAAHPNPVHARRGSWILFEMTPGTELDIEDEDFLEQKGHEGERAWGHVKATAPLGEHHYTAKNLLAPQKAADPEVMIDP